MRLRAAFRLGRQSAEAFGLRVSVVAAGAGSLGIAARAPANEAAPPATDRGRAGALCQSLQLPAVTDLIAGHV